MDGTALWELLRERDIHLEQLAEKTSYSLAYLVQVVTGSTPLSDRAKFRIVKAFPELSVALMEKEKGA